MDHKKEAVEDFFSWLADKNGEDTIALIRKTKGSIPYGAFADYARSHPQLRRRCTFKAGGSMNGKDKGYMKLLRMYMQAINMYFADGPVVAASEAAGETAVAEYSHTAVAVCSENPNRKHIPRRPRLGYEYESTKRGVIQNWSGDDSSAEGGID